MSKSELADNLTFLSALNLLKQLIEVGTLTEEEGQKARAELERQLRPTVVLL